MSMCNKEYFTAWVKQFPRSVLANLPWCLSSLKTPINNHGCHNSRGGQSVYAGFSTTAFKFAGILNDGWHGSCIVDGVGNKIASCACSELHAYISSLVCWSRVNSPVRTIRGRRVAGGM